MILSFTRAPLCVRQFLMEFFGDFRGPRCGCHDDLGLDASFLDMSGSSLSQGPLSCKSITLKSTQNKLQS